MTPFLENIKIVMILDEKHDNVTIHLSKIKGEMPLHDKSTQ